MSKIYSMLRSVTGRQIDPSTLGTLFERARPR
jgi:hypothetical protein